jgi:hypothetical protein
LPCKNETEVRITQLTVDGLQDETRCNSAYTSAPLKRDSSVRDTLWCGACKQKTWEKPAPIIAALKDRVAVESGKCVSFNDESLNWIVVHTVSKKQREPEMTASQEKATYQVNSKNRNKDTGKRLIDETRL